MHHTSLSLASLSQRADQPSWLLCADRSWSSHRLVHAVAALSTALTHILRLEPGSRVLLLGANSDCYIHALLACMDAGLIVVPVNSRWSAQEVAYAVQSSAAQLVLVDHQHLDLAARACSMTQLGQAPAPSPRFVLIGPHLNTLRPSSSMTVEQLMSQVHSLPPESAPAALSSHAPAGPPLQFLSAPCGAALICFTSGTTGRPKGVVLTHSNLHTQSLVKLAVIGYCQQDVYLHLAPLFHMGGLSSLFAVLMAGGAHVVLPKFDPSTALSIIGARDVTSFIAVPTMIQDMAQAARLSQGTTASRNERQGGGKAAGSCPSPPAHPAPASPSSSAPLLNSSQPPCQWQSVKRVLVGAGGTSSQMKAALLHMFPQASLHTAYGMTEACSSITFSVLHTPLQQQQQQVQGRHWAAASYLQAPSQLHQAPGPAPAAPTAPSWGSCAGYPGPGIQVMIWPSEESTDPASGSGSSSTGPDAQLQQQQQPGSGVERVVGEVWTRGPHVMREYWGDAGETAKALAPGGWLRTGDRGYLDAEGQLWLLGRLKDMIKSGGENVYAPEVEAALCTHPAVLAAAVLGLADDRLGEMVAASVILRKPTDWSGPVLHMTNQTGLPSGAAQGPTADGTQPQPGAGYLSPALLQELCRSCGLSGFKLPRFICAQWQPFPSNASGKVLKQELKLQMQQLIMEQRNMAHARSRL